MAEGLPKDLLRSHDTYADKYDPHVWMTPVLWKLVVVEVQKALTKARPDSADVFATNAQVHLADLDQLIAYGEAVLATAPDNNKVLVTAHDAFGNFWPDLRL